MSKVTIQVSLEEAINVEAIVEAIANIKIIPEVEEGNNPKRTIEFISKHVSELIEDALNKTTNPKLALMILEEKLQEIQNTMMHEYEQAKIAK